MFKGLKTCFKGIWDISEAFLGIFRHLKPDFGAKNRVFHWKREKIQIHVTNQTLFYKYGVIRCFKSHTYCIWPFPRFSDIFRTQRWLIAECAEGCLIVLKVPRGSWWILKVPRGAWWVLKVPRCAWWAWTRISHTIFAIKSLWQPLWVIVGIEKYQKTSETVKYPMCKP